METLPVSPVCNSGELIVAQTSVESIPDPFFTENGSRIVTIRPGYEICYTAEYLGTDMLRLCVFSEVDFEHPAVERKYIDQVSSRAYYPSGRKKWFYKMMFRYDFVVPKELFILDREKSDGSYILYKLGNMEIKNNTSGGTGGTNGAWRDLQTESVHHCRIVTKTYLSAIAALAAINEVTIREAERPICVDIDYLPIVFIEKYANGQTNYNKSTKSYSQFYPSGMHPLVQEILGAGCHLSNKALGSIGSAILRRQYPAGTVDILFDYLKWKDMYSGARQHMSIPREVYYAFQRLENIKTARKKRTASQGTKQLE